MGLFDKIKKVGSFLRGNQAQLSIHFDGHIQDGTQPIPLTVHCQVGEQDVEVRKVYLKVRAMEKVEIRNYSLPRQEGETTRQRTDIRDSTQTYQTEIVLAQAQTLSANESYQWETTIDIPFQIAGTYQGQHAWHIWSVFAGLDMSGNDPDSGWVEFEVAK
ncbi:MAG: hypothetical protein AAFR61_28400 [Bacteroidota bacterium]